MAAASTASCFAAPTAPPAPAVVLGHPLARPAHSGARTGRTRKIRNHLDAAGVRERRCVVGVPLKRLAMNNERFL